MAATFAESKSSNCTENPKHAVPIVLPPVQRLELILEASPSVDTVPTLSDDDAAIAADEYFDSIAEMIASGFKDSMDGVDGLGLPPGGSCDDLKAPQPARQQGVSLPQESNSSFPIPVAKSNPLKRENSKAHRKRRKKQETTEEQLKRPALLPRVSGGVLIVPPPARHSVQEILLGPSQQAESLSHNSSTLPLVKQFLNTNARRKKSRVVRKVFFEPTNPPTIRSTNPSEDSSQKNAPAGEQQHLRPDDNAKPGRTLWLPVSGASDPIPTVTFGR
jgi:hypothetical protein